MNVEILKEAGLTPGEIKVYLALLKLGSSTTGPIIEKSSIARSIVYQILDNLMKKGLASFIVKDKTKYFQAASPEKILEFINEREKSLLENKKKVEELIPELLSQQMTSPKNEANFYIGEKGIYSAHENTYKKLKEGEEYYYFGIPSYEEKKVHDYWLKDHKRREKAKIFCKLLFNKDADEKAVRDRNKFKRCEARKMKAGIKTPAPIMVYKDVTLIMVIDPKNKNYLAVEIINQEIADTFKAYFEEFWSKSK